MNSQVASYYRAILYSDGQDQRPLPQSLLNLHMFAEKRHQALGLGSTITKATALAVSLTWMSATKEGKEFTRESTNLGSMFADSDELPPSPGEKAVDWDNVLPEAEVVVIDGGKTMQGHFIGRKSSWIDVRIGNEKKSFRFHQVQLAGV